MVMLAGRRGELLRQPPERHGDLERFLEGQDQLSWLHHVHTGQMGRAASTLRRLALREDKSLQRKKVSLYLSPSLWSWTSLVCSV